MTTRSKRERTRKSGAAMVFVVLAGGALVGITAWATETARMWQAKNQLQRAADSSALAGVGNLLTNDFTTVDENGARTAAQNYGAQHQILGTQLNIPGGDVASGSWDLENRTFTPMPGSADASQVRAVRVRTRRDDTANGPVPTIFGNAIGVAGVTVNTEAVAYWGFAGSGGLGVADLPIAIDCCAVSGSTPGDTCSQDYCTTIGGTTPNPCPLSTGGTATCLEFSSQPDQNACWTVFDGDHPSVNTPDLIDTVEQGNTIDINGPVYLDNGDKVPVIREIRDRFEGRGGYDPAAGTDTDGDGNVDSWVVTLPIAECQNPGDGCAGGDAQDIVGFLCFDIHEVEVTPGRVIKGTFLCPSDPRCDTTGLGPGGTVPGTISAQYPVIVD